MAARTLGESFEVSQKDDEVSEAPSSFLNPVGETAQEVPPKAIGAWMELIVFGFFVLVRAAHPVVISAAKVQVGKDKKYPFSGTVPVVVMTVSLCIINLVFCWAVGGRAQFMSIFDRKPFVIFSINGAIYALGDFLEMGGLEGIPAATYQILQQFRIVLTALLLMPVKGQYQTRLQWVMLCILMFSMGTYMVVDDVNTRKDKGKEEEVVTGDFVMGVMMSLAKVFVSCLGAVITDKYMKKYSSDPTHVCIARTFVARAMFIVLLSVTQYSRKDNKSDPDLYLWRHGFRSFFEGGDWMLVAVTCSFIIKSVSTIYIVALLDSILKNIAEAVSVLFIYGYALASGGSSYHADTMLAVFVVVATCAAYVDSKALVEKASKYDAIQAASA